MAARNPTSWVVPITTTGLVAGEPILQAPYDDLLDNQQYIMDCEQMNISDVFVARRQNTNSYVEIARYIIDMKDHCGSKSSTYTATFSGYVWSDGTADIDLQAASTVGADTQSVTTSATTSAAWCTLTNLTVATDNSEETITVSLRYSGSAGSVYCAGFALFSPED